MRPNSSSAPSDQAAAQGSVPPPLGSRSRRRFVTGTAGGAGVLLAVHARTALGQLTCQSPSAMVSGNLSHTPHTVPCSGGRSPGFWKQPQHFSAWLQAGAVPPTFADGVKIKECQSGLSGLGLDVIAEPGTLLAAVLPMPAPFPGGYDPGIWAVLAFPNEFDRGQLMRHLCAAWLNAGIFDDYAVSRQQIAAMWAAVANGGTYCPTENCGDAAMTADDVIDYISGMYDFNAELELALCKENGGGQGNGQGGGNGNSNGTGPKKK